MINEIQGMNTITNSPNTSTNTNGKIALATRSMDNPEIPDATNKFTPNGGVIIPISAPTINKIPK